MDIRHNLETASRSSQQPLAFPSNIFRGYMLPSMEGSNPLYFVQLGDERRTLSLLLRITDFIHFMNYFFFKVYSFLVWIPPSPITVLKIKMGKMSVLTDVLLQVQLFWQKLSFQESLFVRVNQLSSTIFFLTRKILRHDSFIMIRTFHYLTFEC